MTVTLYGKPNCVQCSATERALTNAGIVYDKIDVTQDEVAYDFVVGLGYQQAPVVYAGQENHWSGFRPEKIESLVA